jgi:hypothetical protein
MAHHWRTPHQNTAPPRYGKGLVLLIVLALVALAAMPFVTSDREQVTASATTTTERR